MTSLPHIAVIGSLNVDLVTRTPRVPAAGETLTASSFTLGFGGKGANQASACSRLTRLKPSSSHKFRPVAAKVSMIGAVGDDQFSNGMLESLTQDGVSVADVRKVKGESTGTATILVEEATGENRILFTAGANYSFGEEEDLVPQDVDVVLFQMEIPLKTVLLPIPLPLTLTDPVKVLHNIEVAKSHGAQVGLPLPILVFL